MMTIPTYDLERVEVMRGPQGTTFGRNATLGLLHFISAKPTEETDREFQATVGDPDLVGFRGHMSGSLTDTINGRIATNYQDADGTMKDTDTGKALEGTKNQSIRGSITWDPSDTFSAWVKAEYINNDDKPQVRRGSECVSPWLSGSFSSYTDSCEDWSAIQDETRKWKLDRDMFLLTAELVWDLGDDIAITSINGYQNGEHHTIQDAFGTPFALRDQLVDNNADVYSTELRVDNYGSGNKFRWLLGAAYTHDTEKRREENIGMPERGGCGGRLALQGKDCPEWHLVQLGDATNDSFGAFGEVLYDLTDSFTISVGGRYTDESRDLDFDVNAWGEASGIAGVGLDNPDTSRDCNLNNFADPLGRAGQSPSQPFAQMCGTESAPMGYSAKASQSWDNFSGKVSVQYALGDNNNLYALYSEGYKAGGFQHDARNIQAFNLFIDPEDMTNYEAGWKGSYDRALFAVTVFQMKQKNTQVGNQVAVGSGNANMVFNASSVKSTGVELEGTFALTDSWQIGGNVGFYDAEFGNGTTTGAVFDPSGQIVPSGQDISGERPNHSPENTAAIWSSYVFDLSGGSSIRLRGNWTHRSDAWARVGGRDAFNIAGDEFIWKRPELDKFGAEVEWTSASDNIKISIWGKNLDDDFDFLAPGPGIGYIFTQGQAGPDGTLERSRPVGLTGRKVVGGTFTYRF
jgi:iron complex outermembrane receptor protein